MATAFALSMALARHLYIAIFGLAVAVLVLMALRPPCRPLLRRLGAVNVFIFFLAITVPLTMPGATLWTLGPLHISQEGLMLVLMVGLKANAIMLVFIAFVATMPVPTLGHALDRLGLSSKLIFLLIFTYRYIHTLAEEWQRLHTAARLRCFVPRTGLHTYRTVGHMLGMVLVNSSDRAGRIYQAMLLRGFNGQFSSVRHFAWSARDSIFSVFWLGVVMMLIATDIFVEF